MERSGRRDATQALLDLSQGDGSARELLLPLVYEELHALGSSYLRRENPDHSFQTTDLIHEAYLRLVDQRRLDWSDRAHFFAVAARVIRRVLTDHARRRRATKRGGAWRKVKLDEHLAIVSTDGSADLPALNEAMDRLAALHQRQCRVVELRFFAGLSIEEAAHVLGVSPRTVDDDWSLARAWLHRELTRGTHETRTETDASDPPSELHS